MGNVGRASVETGTRSSKSGGLGVPKSKVNTIRRSLRSDAPSDAGALVASYLIRGTGLDLLVAVCQLTIYALQKINRYNELVRKYGEDEANRQISVEIGADIVRHVVKQMIVESISKKLVDESNLPPELKERAEAITEDIVEMGVEKLEQQFLEE